MGDVVIIGAGLAGSEAALQLASRKVSVTLVEMRPENQTEVHTSGLPAELVCSNSFKSTNANGAAGILKYELAAMGSKLLEFAFASRVPAGGALAVDRDVFSSLVDAALESDPFIERETSRIDSLESFISSGRPVIVATGPLCSEELAHDIARLLGHENLAFFDAAAPIVEADSLDTSVLFAQSRHDRGGRADYLNAPLTRDEYEAFITALSGAKRVISRDFESSDLFNACQPVEQIALTGTDSLRFGAMKPVGLTDPRTGKRPWAAVQLRAENAAATAYNLVGFQTNLTFGEQKRVFSLIPGLERAVFSRYGVMHRNTFIDAPHALGQGFTLPGHDGIRFAGQICGTEGYMEAVASGLLAALATYANLRGFASVELPRETAFGSLVSYASDPQTVDYQPMHVNFGIFEPLSDPIKNKRERYAAYARRAHDAIDAYVASRGELDFRTFAGPDLLTVSEEDARRS